jgi:hypothetical protein
MDQGDGQLVGANGSRARDRQRPPSNTNSSAARTWVNDRQPAA